MLIRVNLVNCARICLVNIGSNTSYDSARLLNGMFKGECQPALVNKERVTVHKVLIPL